MRDPRSTRPLWLTLVATAVATVLAAVLTARQESEDPTAHAAGRQESGFVCPPCNGECDTVTHEAAGECPDCGMTLIPVAGLRNVAIVLWTGVELLDFAGPAEVFSTSRSSEGAFRVFTVARREDTITSQGFLRIVPQYTFENCPQPDVVVLPGGGVSRALEDERLLAWLEHVTPDSEIQMSVCTGAFVLARAGMLNGLEATTHHSALDTLRELAPMTTVRADVRYVDNGRIVTSGGIATGIDAALHVVGRLLGEDSAIATAKYLEYDWNPDADGASN